MWCPSHGLSCLPASGPAQAELIPSPMPVGSRDCLTRVCLHHWTEFLEGRDHIVQPPSLHRVCEARTCRVCLTYISWGPRELGLSTMRAEHVIGHRPLTKSNLKIIPTVTCVSLMLLKSSPLHVPVPFSLTSSLQALNDTEPRDQFVQNLESLLE